MYTIERKGDVQIEPDGRTQRCGEMDTRDYKYRVRIDVHELSAEGWVIDNRAVPSIVSEVAASNPRSCEHFCDDICQALLLALGVRARGVIVEVEGIVGSHIRTYWGEIPLS